jgi:hypothetical protein
MTKQSGNEILTRDELIREAIGFAAAYLIKNNLPVTTRGLSQTLMEEERTDIAERKAIYQEARKWFCVKCSK